MFHLVDVAFAFRIAENQAKVSSTLLATFTDGFWDPAEVDAAYELARPVGTLAPSGSFFFDVENVMKGADYARELEPYFGALALPFVHHMRMSAEAFPNFLSDGGKVIELFVRDEIAPMPTVLPHLDHNDRDAERIGMRFPMWASVFHLGPKSGVRGGSTFVATEQPIPKRLMDRVYTPMAPADVAALDTEWLEAPRKQNRMLIFRGDLVHYLGPITEVDPKSPRITILVNGWDELPVQRSELKTPISVFTPEEFAVIKKVKFRDLVALSRLLEKNTLEELAKIAKYFTM